MQTATDASSDYVVPAGGKAITSWSFATLGGTPGTAYGLVVVRPTATGDTLVGTDSELIPASAPAIETFPLASPIVVQAGDLLGVQVGATETVPCVFAGGVVNSSDVVSTGLTSGAIGSSISLTPTLNGGSTSPQTSSRPRTWQSRSARLERRQRDR